MKKLNREVLDQHLDELLTGSQIKCLLQRRDLLVEQLEKRIAKKGEREVLFKFFR